MISIAKQYTFDSAHILHNPNWDSNKNSQVFGKCSRLHGHTYILTVEVTGDVTPDDGMILNYFDLDKVVKPYVDGMLDHQFLNDVFKELNGRTTAENMVRSIAKEIAYLLTTDGVRLASVTLQETPKTFARWTSDA